MGGGASNCSGCALTKTIHLGRAYKRVTVAMDYIQIDGWDGEYGTVYVNGEEVFSQQIRGNLNSLTEKHRNLEKKQNFF